MIERAALEAGYDEIQARFSAAISALDGGSFAEETWERPGGGGGRSRTLIDGDLIERAAVNVSAVWGETPSRLSESRAGGAAHFYATGVSIIVHPRSPHAPTFHANLRFFETDGDDRWFGGGADLTPYYLYDEDARHFHGVLRDVCGRHSVADYQTWRRTCDEYFFLPHRGERRGVGGLFFDHLTDRLESVWAMQQDLGHHLVAAYLPILERRMGQPWSEAERAWQELRRGRYVEFNLVWDRGTRFGLETGGRTESILASLPPTARWDETFHPAEGSPEQRMLDVLTGETRSWI